MSSPEHQDYNEDYFSHYCGDRAYARDDYWLGHFRRLAERIVESSLPATALDVGCAFGMLVEILRDIGVEAYGIDVSEYALSQAREDVSQFLWQASATEALPRQYDLITCIEVLEHLPQSEAESALDNMCAHTDDILFSSTPLDYREATHVNVHQPEYWAEQFARRGFFRDHDFDASVVTPWAGRFRRDHHPVPLVISGYERRIWHLGYENVEIREALLESRAMADEATAARDALLQTRTFRYTQPLRGIYDFLRERTPPRS